MSESTRENGNNDRHEPTVVVINEYTDNDVVLMVQLPDDIDEKHVYW